MAVETDVLDELRRLRTRVPGLTGSLAATVDGLVLAHDVPEAEPEGLAALTAAALGVAYRMTDAAARGDFRELLVRGADGYVATYAAGTTAVLTLLAEDRVNVGRLHLEGRRGGARIADLVATRVGPGTGRHADRPTPTPTSTSTPTPTPTPTPRATPAAAPPSPPAPASPPAPEEHIATAPPATARPIGTLPVRTPQRPTHPPRPQTGI
ncbi:roadblock/LC7 domain-containing protein [Streptomyces olindensis]|uniref:roadblock/LC7 domain-containing protein n=1 Tax=Streptomyces olindensis TaxID=358823 RepID=UPI003405C0FE